jgi:hypothetical protein
MGKKTASSSNVAGETGFLHAETEQLLPILGKQEIRIIFKEYRVQLELDESFRHGWW